MSLKTNRFQGSLLLFLAVLTCLTLASRTIAQTEVNGAFEGHVTNKRTGEPIVDATVSFTELSSGVELPPKRTDANGYFYQGMLPPGRYRIRASSPGFQTREEERLLQATLINQVIPVPMPLEPETPLPISGPTPPVPSMSPPTQSRTAPAPTGSPTGVATTQDRDVESRSRTLGPRRGGIFTGQEVVTLPLGAVSLTRTFDELALLLPGVALPPQTLGGITGPGVGPGIGSAGQFAVNGLRSRANNFTVDGSDNNDEDVGVRRQGFLALVPQPIESIQEYQVMTLLAPAQFGRNVGAQVNAISKAGSKSTHGTVYGFFNSSQLNARNFFDTANGNGVSPLLSGTDPFLFTGRPSGNQRVLLNGSPLTVRNESDDKDSFTLGQLGFVLGGPIKPNRTFYFVSAERQILNATNERSFAVPTVAQRGAFGSGASGIFLDPFGHVDPETFTMLIDPAFGFPTSRGGDAIYSLFPFPNNPGGIYGVNTLTQVLPASGRGLILSGRLDHNFQFGDKQQSITGRYNFTDDWRDIPSVGGAIFASMRAETNTHNFSVFLNSELTDPNSVRPIFNQLRFSYGHTNLDFKEVRDSNFLLPSRYANTPFLLNAPLIANFTLPAFAGEGGENKGDVIYRSDPGFRTVEDVLGPVGQVDIKGFSPVGVDVNYFPQKRANKTYQLADILTWRAGSSHNVAFGTDIRRAGSISDLPRNFRPLFTFGGTVWTDVIADSPSFRTLNPRADFEPFFTFLYGPQDLAAIGAATSITQTLATSNADPKVGLHYYQLAFFGQDEWRIGNKLSLSLGLRYEFNTPISDAKKTIENGFSALSSLLPGLPDFIAGRNQTYQSDRNNFAPRVGIAYAPQLFGINHTTVLRSGFGIFYDQIPGAVVSQSRGVFPDFLTVNLAGGTPNVDPRNTYTLDPIRQAQSGLIQPGNTVLNTLSATTSLADKLRLLQSICTGRGAYPQSGCFEITLPAQNLQMPMAYQYHLTLEQQLGSNIFVSAAYVGTKGDHLLRYATPNLGPNSLILPTLFLGAMDPTLANGDPKLQFQGIALSPGTRIENTLLVGGRPIPNLGAVNVFQTTASSHYDAFQLQVRGRLSKLGYQASYTFSKSIDDASDFFELAGAPAVPQNSTTFAGERALSNFDAPHRFAYSFIYDFPSFRGGSAAKRFFFDGLEIAGTGQFQSGQPFTVNSIHDINVDGNLSDRLNTTDGIVITGDRWCCGPEHLSRGQCTGSQPGIP